MTRTSPLAKQLSLLNQQIHSLEHIHQRIPNSVKLIAVSKAQPATKIAEAFAAGQTVFAENYLQEALIKMSELQAYPIEWHFIGHIQSNKARQIAEHFSWVHSVCSLEVAERLGHFRPSHLEPLNICIQINLSNETTKSGIQLEQLDELAASINQIKGIHLRGLMLIPAANLTPELQKQTFSELRAALEKLNKNGCKLDTLSMGMSDDFPAAIAEGATMIRIGRALFGDRV